MLRKVIQRAVFTTIALVGIININNSIYTSGSASASTSDLTMSATINPSSTVEISANTVALNVVPSASGTFKASTPLTVNAYTNSNYNCTITMETASTSLTSGGNSIATLDNTYTESTFVNDKWGFSTDATNYGPVALTNSVGTFSATTPNAASITFAAKLTQATKPGTYSGEVTFATTCTPPPVTINDLTYMQDFATLSSADKTSVLNSMTTSTQYQLEDNRDQNDYYISKLADGKIWMTQNLDLAGGTTLVPASSNVLSSHTLPASENIFDLTNVPRVHNTGSTDCSSTNGCYSYYNHYAACVTNEPSSSYTCSEDICPAGWRLPNGQEFTNLISYYSTGDALTTGPFHAVYAGYYVDEVDNNTTKGFYWTNHAGNNINADFLEFTSSSARLTYDLSHTGFSVRCLTKS